MCFGVFADRNLLSLTAVLGNKYLSRPFTLIKSSYLARASQLFVHSFACSSRQAASIQAKQPCPQPTCLAFVRCIIATGFILAQPSSPPTTTTRPLVERTHSTAKQHSTAQQAQALFYVVLSFDLIVTRRAVALVGTRSTAHNTQHTAHTMSYTPCTPCTPPFERA